jgi:putative hydrolase of the HAD superfamily
MPVEAAIFDIGGVLEVNPPTGWQDRWASRLGLDRQSLEARLAEIWPAGSVGRSTLEEIESRTAGAIGLDATGVTLLMDDAWSEYVGSLNEELTRYFAALRPRVKTGILSNSFVGAREREQAAYGFEDICDVVVYSHEIGYLKPDARAYHAVCEQLEVAPGQALFLDDVEANVQGAIAAGLHAVAFADNEQAIVAVERHLDSTA